ncbi:hypothetical protein BLAT2472_30210 [Burkholderia latens]
MVGGTLAGAWRMGRLLARGIAPASGNRLLSSGFICTPVGCGWAARAITAAHARRRAAGRHANGVCMQLALRAARMHARGSVRLHGAGIRRYRKIGGGFWPVRPEGRRILLPGMRQKTRLCAVSSGSSQVGRGPTTTRIGVHRTLHVIRRGRW